MNLLEAAKNRKSGTLSKWENYFREYDAYFAEYRDRPVRLMEIGVQGGGSLSMWKEYFPHAKIVGVDIDDCSRFATSDISIYQGDQADPVFLASIPGTFDIIIDDGGHTMRQQQVSFQHLFPRVNEGGMYVIEDLHTSYWPEFGGGYTMMEFLKDLIDEMHDWARKSHRASFFRGRLRHFHRAKLPVDNGIRSITFADSMCFIKKDHVEKGKQIKLS